LLYQETLIILKQDLTSGINIWSLDLNNVDIGVNSRFWPRLFLKIQMPKN